MGSYSIIFGSLGNGVTNDFIEEIEVITGGYNAEFGRATGGVVNVVTKSGSNEFKGSGSATPVRARSKADWKQKGDHSQRHGQHRRARRTPETSVSPLRRTARQENKVFFFGAFNPNTRAPHTFVAPAGRLSRLRRSVTSIASRRIANYAAKGSWQLDSGASLRRLALRRSGARRQWDRSAARRCSSADDVRATARSIYGGHNQTVRYNGVLTPHLLVEASAGHAVNRIVETPSLNEWRVLDERATPRISSGGLGFYEAGNHSDSWQAQAKATDVFNARGAHQLRYGVDYETLDFSQLQQFTGPDLHRSGRAADGDRRQHRASFLTPCTVRPITSAAPA